ncbi:MAG: DUF2155 domain-containing protein [Paracoccus sp. (in: a-proteobacteria)]|nr:DUF2155 domain-containing protein [Paracoccus sp. (in: a-proteobacteria)]
MAMRAWMLAGCLSLAAGSLAGQSADAPAGSATSSSTAETQRGTGAVLRGLDRVSGRATDLQLLVGEAVRYGRLEIRLGECRYPTANPNADAFAQLTIVDLRQNTQVFAGWMLASAPALSALDDARYDIWVISCQS